MRRVQEKHQERGRSVYETEQELQEDEQLREQLGEMVNVSPRHPSHGLAVDLPSPPQYIMLKARARRIAQAQGVEKSKARIEKQLVKSAKTMHGQT